MRDRLLHAPAQLAEHTMVRLRRDLPDSRLSAGACGAIVFAGGADGYLVEFGEGEQGRVLAVKCDDVEPVAE